MNIKQIKKQYGLPTRWNKSQVTSYMIGYREGMKTAETILNENKLQSEFKLTSLIGRVKQIIKEATND